MWDPVDVGPRRCGTRSLNLTWVWGPQRRFRGLAVNCSPFGKRSKCRRCISITLDVCLCQCYASHRPFTCKISEGVGDLRRSASRPHTTSLMAQQISNMRTKTLKQSISILSSGNPQEKDKNRIFRATQNHPSFHKKDQRGNLQTEILQFIQPIG